MKRLLVISVFFFCNVAFQPVFALKEEPLDKIVAVVNEDVITQSELAGAVNVAKMQYEQQNLDIPAQPELKKQVLDSLINKKLQLQIAKQANVKITDADLDNAIQNVASQNNMSTEELYGQLTHGGMSQDDYRHEIREQLTIQKLQQQEVMAKVNVTEDEVERYIQAKMMHTASAKEYQVVDLLIPLSDEPTAEEINVGKERAQAIVARLHKGENPQAILKSESSKTLALEKNELGWRKIKELPSAFMTHIVGLDKNEVAGPVKTSNGYHVLKLADVRTVALSTEPPDKKEVQQVLLQKKYQEAVRNWVSKLRGQAFIVANK